MSTTALISIAVLILIAIFILLRIFRKPVIDPNDFKDQWRTILLNEVVYYLHLIPEERLRFERDVLVFFSKVRITGVDTEINDKDRLLVASSAVIPLFGYPGSSFDNISEVLIYKGRFNHSYETEGGKDRNILGMVGDGVMNRHMILSKKALRKGYDNRDKSQNVGIHEFVHLLDKADGQTDGIPKFVLRSKEIQPWLDIVNGEIQDIIEGKSRINPYGATNEAEFFSVVSEYFFMQPDLLQQNHPELYKKLMKIYRQDPAQGLGKLTFEV
ncbi:MAG: zinc-dependent peptidase [Saprospiraceae bacterium]|nr:zinc-dependent peptidase [Saprospiraceae bacterium]